MKAEEYNNRSIAHRTISLDNYNWRRRRESPRDLPARSSKFSCAVATNWMKEIYQETIKYLRLRCATSTFSIETFFPRFIIELWELMNKRTESTFHKRKNHDEMKRNRGRWRWGAGGRKKVSIKEYLWRSISPDDVLSHEILVMSVVWRWQ